MLMFIAVIIVTNLQSSVHGYPFGSLPDFPKGMNWQGLAILCGDGTRVPRASTAASYSRALWLQCDGK